MGNGESASSVLGLTLQLQKYGVGNIGCNGTSSLRVMGYYDGLLIRKIQKWFDYSPRKDWEPVNNVDNSGEDLVNHYPIKLIFPELEQDENLPPLFYNDWKNYETLLGQNPCMTLVLVNLTSTYRQRHIPQLLPSFLKSLKESCDPANLEKTHCCVLPSLGYSDFCILMADDNWKSALQFVEKLHELVDDNTAVLSTDYMMPVLYGIKFNPVAKYFADIALTVRLHLRPGTQVNHLSLPEGVVAYRPSGGSDCLLHAEAPAAQAHLLQYLLNTKASSIVMDIASTLCLPLDTTTKEPSVPPSQTDDSSTGSFPLFFESFKSEINKYKEMLSHKRRHLRQANALLELCSSIEGICNYPHTGDLKIIIQKLIENFSDCLRRCTAGMDTNGWRFEEMEQSLGAFCDIISSFISDLSRSDCFFIERQRYNHPSIGSATSLLLAYNVWLNKFTDDVRNATGQGEKSAHSFLVTSGGQDRTQTFNAFEFLEPDEKDGDICEKVPLITQMAEMSLFDFSGTILRCVHECMHFCGIRLREDRFNFMTDFVAAFFAREIAQALFTDTSELEYARSICKAFGCKEHAAALNEKINGSYDERRRALQTEITTSLKAYLTASYDPPKNYLLRNVHKWMYDALVRAFSGYTFRIENDGSAILAPNVFAAQIHDAVRCALIGYRNDCDKHFKAAGVDTSVFAFQRNKFQTYMQNEKADPVISVSVQLVLSRILIAAPPSSLPADEGDQNYLLWERYAPYIALSQKNLTSTLGIVDDIFSETFADIMACKILGARIEDYLLMHLYEDWDPNFSLESEMANEYRIPAVLRLCFPESLDTEKSNLNESCKKSFASSIKCLEMYGMPKGRLCANEICERVGTLLQAFKENEVVAKPLMDYLQACLNKYSKLHVWENLEKYAESFKKIRLLSIVPGSESANEQLVKMYYSLIHWEGNTNVSSATCVH